MLKAAHISPCQRYRYTLRRGPVDTGGLTFLCLNPSTANAELDDPTVRKCIGFTERLGATGFTIVNLFAWRATNPLELLEAGDPVGPQNDVFLSNEFMRPVICAWGAPSSTKLRRMVEHRIVQLAHLFQAHGQETWHLGPLTLNGSPRHPLYLPYDADLEPWGPQLLTATAFAKR
jgi:hypothetical protein